MDERSKHPIEPSADEPQAVVALPYERLGRMILVMVLCLLAIALFLGFLIESLRADQYTLSFELADLPVSFTEISHNHGRLVRDTTIVAVLVVAVGVMWMVWQYRAHANMRALVPGVRWHPALAVAVWFIPVVNVVLPPLALRELWKVSDLHRQNWRKAWTTPLLWVWWLLVLATVALTVWALAPMFHADPNLEELFVRDHRGVIAAGVGIPTTVVTGVLIAWLDARLGLKETQAGGRWKGWAERRRTE